MCCAVDDCFHYTILMEIVASVVIIAKMATGPHSTAVQKVGAFKLSTEFNIWMFGLNFLAQYSLNLFPTNFIKERTSSQSSVDAIEHKELLSDLKNVEQISALK